jgi:hypothetical protein
LSLGPKRAAVRAAYAAAADRFKKVVGGVGRSGGHEKGSKCKSVQLGVIFGAPPKDAWSGGGRSVDVCGRLWTFATQDAAGQRLTRLENPIPRPGFAGKEDRGARRMSQPRKPDARFTLDVDQFHALVAGQVVRLHAPGSYETPPVTVELILADIGFSEMSLALYDAMRAAGAIREVKDPGRVRGVRP